MILHAKTALLANGWAENVRITVAEGRIVEIGTEAKTGALGCLLPAPVNLHSHCFQRAMAGMTEGRSAGQDSFWTWRSLMYRFLDHLTPEDVQAIAALAMVEMAEAGFAGLAEFHYLHHRPGGGSYADLAEMAGRIAAAAAETGLGLTLLPVLYQQGGCDGRSLQAGQLRFGCDRDRYGALLTGAQAALRGLPADTGLGVAPHSLRAVSREALAEVARMLPGGPVHLHLAEQVAEVEEVRAAYGVRPVEWLLGNVAVDARWCLIHATQMEPPETLRLAATGAVAGLCPITEANLGDGIFDGVRWQGAGGQFGVGSDSNVLISLRGELQMLEYSQRLQQRGRALLAEAGRSTGRVLLDSVCKAGAQAAGRQAGSIAVGQWADLMALDAGSVVLEGHAGDGQLDAWIFAGNDGLVTDVWSAGRHLVQGGRHRARDAVEARYRRVMADLRARL